MTLWRRAVIGVGERPPTFSLIRGCLVIERLFHVPLLVQRGSPGLGVEHVFYIVFVSKHCQLCTIIIIMIAKKRIKTQAGRQAGRQAMEAGQHRRRRPIAQPQSPVVQVLRLPQPASGSTRRDRCGRGVVGHAHTTRSVVATMPAIVAGVYRRRSTRVCRGGRGGRCVRNWRGSGCTRG